MATSAFLAGLSAWHWIAANGLSILYAIYLAATVCLLVLALIVRANSRKLRHLARASQRHAVLIDTLMKAADEQGAPEAPNARTDDEPAAPATDTAQHDKSFVSAEMIRDELQLLRAELLSDESNRMPDRRPAER